MTAASCLIGSPIAWTARSATIRIALLPARSGQPYAENARDWLLIVDEVPQVEAFEELALPDTHRLFTDHFRIVSIGAAYGQLASRRAK